MESEEYNIGEPYWDHCETCGTSGIHEYAGFQKGFGFVKGFHMGTCSNCGSTTKVPLEKRVEDLS